MRIGETKMGINNNYVKATVGLALAVSSVPIIAPAYMKATTYSDVSESAYYYDAVQELAERGIINGYGDATFKPNEVATRGQTAKILASILGLDTINVVDPGFTDLSPDNPYYGAIAALVQAGIINGYEDRTFRMNEPLKRNHLAKMLVKAFNLQSPEGVNLPFTDVHQSYKDYILALYANEITTGRTEMEFDGESYVTRGQLAAFVVRTEVAVQIAKDQEQPNVDPTPPIEPIPTPDQSLTFTLSIDGMSEFFSSNDEYELMTSAVIGKMYLEGDVVNITFVSEDAIPKESFKVKINGVEYEFKFNKNEKNWGAKKVKEAISTVPEFTPTPTPTPVPEPTPKPPSTISVTGISLNSTTGTIILGETGQLTASILPVNATNKNVTWTTSDNNVATVDNKGKVTAVGVGNAIITAKTADGAKTATAAYTITKKALNIAAPTIAGKVYDGTTAATVTPGTLNGVVAGEDVTVSAVATYDNANVGRNKEVTVVYTLGGADASNYTAPANTVVTTGEITAMPVTASSNGIATATGTTTITLGQVIPGLTASDIVVKKDGIALLPTEYTLGILTGTTVDITFDATAGLAYSQVITVEITKIGYTINGGSAINITNTIDALSTALYAKIGAATTVLNATSVGTGVGQVAQADKDTLATAITTAQGVYDARATKTQAELDSATTVLDNAITTFNGKIIVSNRAPVIVVSYASSWEISKLNESLNQEILVIFQGFLRKIFQDPDGDNLSYTVTSSDVTVATIELLGNDNMQFQRVSKPQSPVEVTFTITAHDGKGGTVSEVWKVTINN